MGFADVANENEKQEEGKRMSYYGERIFEKEHLIAVGDTKISDLTENQQQFIAGMQAIYDCIDDEECEYDDCDSILEKMIAEISVEALEKFKQRIMSEMVEVVVTFADMNANAE